MELEPTEIVFSNNRRVTKCAKVITPVDENPQYSYILCADAMFGASLMDGKFKVIRVKESVFEEVHYMETTHGVSAIEFFQFETEGQPQEFVVLGMENGSVHVYDYTKNKASNYSKLIFNVKSHANSANNNPQVVDASYERFSESQFNQQGSITAIEQCPSDPRQFLCSSKDGSLTIWKFVEVTSPTVDQEKILENVFQFTTEISSKSSKPSSITSAKWLDGDNIVLSLKNGSLVKFNLESKKSELVHFYEYNPIWAIEVENKNIIVACDSGEVFQGEEVIAKGIRESGMTLSQNQGRLTCGFQRTIRVLENQVEVKKVTNTCDNVSFALTAGK